MNRKLIRLWATKTKNDEWWSSFVTSPLAIALNYIFVDFKCISPNLITVFSFIIALISAVFIILGGMGNFIIAAILIQFSHILDCMDGQMARYKNITSFSGSYYDKLTDHIQITVWFGSVGYAAYSQSHNVLPVFLAFLGVAFYSLRGYVKYVALYTEICRDNKYLEKKSAEKLKVQIPENAGLEFGVLANLKWFVREQSKIILFDEGVLIFMLSFALILDKLIPMLWVFAISQISYGIARSWQRGRQISLNQKFQIKK